MIYLKAVRIIDGKYCSVYSACRQWYEIGKRIDCPNMFVYAPGDRMSEYHKDRWYDDSFALLAVECSATKMAVGDLSETIWSVMSISASQETVNRALSSVRGWRPRYEGDRMYTAHVTNSLVPIGVIDDAKLDGYESNSIIIAPPRRSFKHLVKEMANA